MDRKIRILGILPYEGMKPLMASLEEEFPSVDLTLFVGDMEKAWRSPRTTSTETTMWSSPGAAPLKCSGKI